MLRANVCPLFNQVPYKFPTLTSQLHTKIMAVILACSTGPLMLCFCQFSRLCVEQ
ncbi:10055_t:CDS:2 [Ambispora leptoticha]|uniref:10055_t:CDS:1 n=1 Tax=Ambispora leptoticha TaxID=144679 RepID=A0A9N9AZ08_9GLOM|nr:10055_t:CDS:2 [Ambispora leptoticha]